jgi:adenylate cyclase
MVESDCIRHRVSLFRATEVEVSADAKQSATRNLPLMGAKLSVQPAIAEPFEVAIGNTATIGRTRENTVCLNFSPLVSRQHAIIRCHNGWQYQLIDLGSRNGTYVNGQRVVMPITLEDDAEIRIADNVITFTQADAGCDEHQLVTVADKTGSTQFEARQVALLVCDIRGFSTISEQIASSDLAQFLGAWFKEASHIIATKGGIIDKFIGDAVLAYWAGGIDGTVDCKSPLEVALKLHHLAAQRTWPGGSEFRIAVALHYGRATCSNVGVAAERDATIIGDSVNTVFRLETVSKEANEPLVASADFANQIPGKPDIRDLGSRELKGKSQPIQVVAFDVPRQ